MHPVSGGGLLACNTLYCRDQMAARDVPGALDGTRWAVRDNEREEEQGAIPGIYSVHTAKSQDGDLQDPLFPTSDTTELLSGWGHVGHRAPQRAL